MKDLDKANDAKNEQEPSTTALVEPTNVPLVWGQVEYWLNKGERYTRGYYTNEQLYTAIMGGQMQLWVAYKASKIRTIMLTQLDFYPECLQFRYVLIVGTPGSFNEIVHDFKKVELWAMTNGATRGCIIGRDAWIKKLAGFGYYKKSVVLVKELVNTDYPSNRRH